MLILINLSDYFFSYATGSIEKTCNNIIYDLLGKKYDKVGYSV